MPLKGRRAKEPHLIRRIRQLMQRRSLPRLHPQERLEMLRQVLLREHLEVHLLRRGLLVFSVALDRDPVEPIGQVARVVPDRVVAVLDQADPGRIGHRVSIHLALKKACARDPARTQLVRRWDRDLRDQQGPKEKRGLRVIVRRDSIVDRVLNVDHDPNIVDRDPTVVIVDRDLRVPKEPQREIVRRDLKVQQVIDRRDLKVVVASSEARALTGEDVLIRVDRDPKEAQGRRMRGRRKLELQFRRPNPRHRKQQSLPHRLQNRLLHRRSPYKTS